MRRLFVLCAVGVFIGNVATATRIERVLDDACFVRMLGLPRDRVEKTRGMAILRALEDRFQPLYENDRLAAILGLLEFLASQNIRLVEKSVVYRFSGKANGFLDVLVSDEGKDSKWYTKFQCVVPYNSKNFWIEYPMPVIRTGPGFVRSVFDWLRDDSSCMTAEVRDQFLARYYYALHEEAFHGATGETNNSIFKRLFTWSIAYELSLGTDGMARLRRTLKKDFGKETDIEIFDELAYLEYHLRYNPHPRFSTLGEFQRFVGNHKSIRRGFVGFLRHEPDFLAQLSAEYRQFVIDAQVE